MTVRYRSATLGEFIEHHSYDVSRGGMFIKTPSPFPAGTLLKFEVKIAEEQRLMQGVGRVVWKREGEQAGENAPAGMGIKFIKIDEASHQVIERLVENRGHGGPSAFDQSSPAGPSKSQRMFPEHAPLGTTPSEGEAPPPVGLPTGDGAASSPSIEALADEASADSGPPDAVSETRPTRKTAGKGKSAGGAVIAGAEAGAGKTPSAQASPGGKAAGRRWFVVGLIVLFVLAMLYVLTHKAPEGPVGSWQPSAARPDGIRLL